MFFVIRRLNCFIGDLHEKKKKFTSSSSTCFTYLHGSWQPEKSSLYCYLKKIIKWQKCWFWYLKQTVEIPVPNYTLFQILNHCVGNGWWPQLSAHLSSFDMGSMSSMVPMSVKTNEEHLFGDKQKIDMMRTWTAAASQKLQYYRIHIHK